MFEVCIDVDNVEKAIDFYGSAIGLQVVERDPGWARMADGEIVFWIMKCPSGSSASTDSSIPRDYRRHWTPVHLDFVVADLDATTRRAIAAGGKLEGKIQERPGHRLATVADPFGHGLDLVQRSAKS
jgi:predicted enzyme related to lactoylglutathione lyase